MFVYRGGLHCRRRGGGGGGGGVYVQRSCHGFLSWESPVVERVHVNDLLCLDDDGRLRLLFEAALALQRHAQLVHHGTAERSLRSGESREGKVMAGITVSATLLKPVQLGRLEYR